MAYSASLRRPVNGTGTVSVTGMGGSKPARLVFSQVQTFKRGAMIVISIGSDREKYTIDHGQGTEWQAAEKGGSGGGPWNFKTTDTTTSRARGDVDGCFIVPFAKHFLYVAPLDASGNWDWYAYIDTIYPENGRHPYTRDRYTGQFLYGAPWVSVATEDVALVPDVATRVGDLDSLPPVLRV